MSGFSDNSNNVKYFGIFQGKFTLQTTEEEAKSNPLGVTRVNQNGKTVHELHYGSFTGQLVKIFTEKHEEFGHQIAYQFVANNELYQFKVGLNSSQARAINYRLPNINLDEEFTLTARPEEYDNGKIGTAIFVSQGYNDEGKPNHIKFYWTKDHPNGLPPAEKIVDGTEEKWLFGKQRKFVLDYINKNIIPKLTPVTEAMVEAAQDQSSPAPSKTDAPDPSRPSPDLDEPEDDLPF